MTGLTCPSAQPDMQGAQVLGVVERGETGAQLAYVNGHVPVSDAILQATGDVPPTLVYRFAAPCAEKACTHFAKGKCQLAARVAAGLAPRVDRLPPCAIRKTCRWHAQEGAAACARCPQVVTRLENPDPDLLAVAGGEAVAG